MGQVVRGGTYEVFYYLKSLRPSFNNWYLPEYRAGSGGFRLIRKGRKQ